MQSNPPSLPGSRQKRAARPLLLPRGLVRRLYQSRTAPVGVGAPLLHRFFQRKRALFVGRAPKLTCRRLLPPRGRRKR
jgi:hypothetical protein